MLLVSLIIFMGGRMPVRKGTTEGKEGERDKDGESVKESQTADRHNE